jgi:hypothetical protein
LKLSLALLALFSVNALADDSFTCTGHGETVVVSQSRFDESLTHNGRKFKDCHRKQWNAGTVAFDCENGSIDDSIQLFVDLKNGHPVKAGLGYVRDGSVYGGETDGSSIDLTCKE